MTNPDILNGLNPEQKKAVMTTEGPLLIIAGAGSGKTRVLTNRVAYLIEKGVAPYNILALTFTNKAAKEMKERISKIVTPYEAYRIAAGTFHSIFARILRVEAEKLGYTSSFSIYDTDDSLSVIRQSMDAMGMSTKEMPPQGMRSRISSAKNKMISWQNYAQSADNVIEKQTGMVYEAYERRLRASNAMDFDDLLLNMIVLLRNNPDTLKKYGALFKYILVDEYQDTNRAQYIVINMLAKEHNNLCVVGDDAQSIYRWRGAEIRNILEFQNDYPNLTTIKLEQNYRSTKTILSAADSIIKNNRNQLPKTLFTDNDPGDKIEIIPCSDEKLEADRICKIINKTVQDSEHSPKDFAVLYRTNAQSLALEYSLRKNKLPYVIVGGLSFYKRKEIKDAVSYLKLLFNPSDGAALLRVINEPPRGIGLTSLRHIRAFADLNNISLFDAFRQADSNGGLQSRAKKAAANFTAFIERYIKMKEESSPSETAIEFIEASGILKMYKDIGTDDSLDRWNNIQQLLADISDFFRKNKEAVFEDYLQQIALMSDIDEKELGDDQVKLMTLHSAKGLEFPIVFISGLEQGIFPLAKAETDPEEEEEERRLFYVGITRAEKKLYMSYAVRRNRFGEIKHQMPSAFLRELNPECVLQNKRQANTTPSPAFRSKAMRTTRSPFVRPQPIPEELNYKKGDEVKHSQFGLGKVEAVAGSGDNVKAVVFFRSVGRKVLMLKFAKLERM